MVPVPSPNTQEVLAHTPHHRPHESCLQSGAKAQHLPWIPGQWARVHRERRARIEEVNAGWPGVRCSGPPGSWTTLLPNLSDLCWVWGTEWVGLTVTAALPWPSSSALWLTDFQMLLFSFPSSSWSVTCHLFLDFIYLFICIPCDGGYRTLVKLAADPMGGSCGGGQG